MKNLVSLLAAFWLSVNLVFADEGMWLLPMLDKLNISTMHELGCQLSAEEIYSINESCIKDAIVIFGGGCTAEIVSDEGLIFTNHHCGYDAIQKLSTLEHNYLRDGFWARSHEEELPCEGLEVYFMRQFIDVTDSVLADVTDEMSEKDRDKAINEASRRLIKRYKNEDLEADIESFFGGNQYFLVAYQVYDDIRLVGTPPESIGKFGHDTDNWVWPRHTGDFSIFRVYSDSKGYPISYHPDNIPLKPKYFLPISLDGYRDGDFAMVLGFPGSTERYMSSYGIDAMVNIENASRIEPRQIKQDIWREDMLADPKINIQYATKYAHSSNYWKNSIGMNRDIKKLHIIEDKQVVEHEFENWAFADDSRKEKYGTVLTNLKAAYDENAPYNKAIYYIHECLLRGCEIYNVANKFRRYKESAGGWFDEDEAEYVKEKLSEFYKDYSPSTDKKVVAALLKYYSENIDSKFHPSFFATIASKYKNDFERYAEDLFSKSMFADSARVYKFLQNMDDKELENDLGYKHAICIYNLYSDTYDLMESSVESIEQYERIFLAGLMEMNPDKVFYPDANFTMRLTYGTVGDYAPADAVRYNYFTTLAGVMEKEDPTNWEFIVPEQLKELYANSDYGRYADADGTMHVCFITDNDITGGNSGSPVIDSRGRLIGLAFDGNWEAMSGDVAFNKELQKCITVDIRYVLFIIDKFGGAQNIIDELLIQ